MASPPPFDSLPAAREPGDAPPLAGDDDFILGWECAAPALQVEGWVPEADRNSPSGFH